MRKAICLALLAALLGFPLVAAQWGLAFYVGLATRVAIYALAATSLNLILGYGGLASFGHAAYLGLGAYTVAALGLAGVGSAWVAWPVAMLVAGVAACGIGTISLRTRGVYFIMITLAFAQMIYYLVVSIRPLGGDDGLSLTARSTLGFGLDPLSDRGFYYVALVLLGLSLWGLHRVAQSRFGVALAGARDNEARTAALGFPVFRLRLAAFVLAGMGGGLAGALLANQNHFVSPNLLGWSQSGHLMIMVILGGVGRLWGGVLGAVVFLGVEEVLSGYTTHGAIGLALLLLAVVLFARRGLAELLARLVGGPGAQEGAR